MSASAVDELSAAIDDGSIRPWYQPVVKMSTGELIGFEALARWHRERDGQPVVDGPAAFVDLAEEHGLVTRLDVAIFEHCLVDLAGWLASRPGLFLGSNFSAAHLGRPGWTEELVDRVERAGVPPVQLNLELTESGRPEDLGDARGQLADLRAAGFGVWLDDFGIGWSQLRHLVELPVDGLKIDRYFVLESGPASDAVLRALAGVAAELDLGTVIEGIEEPADAARGLALGFDIAQGYLWSRPVPATEATRMVLSGGGFTASAR